MNKEQIKLEIIDKIKMAAKSKVNIEYRIKALKPFKDYSRIVKDREGKFEYIVAIGTSTEGQGHYRLFSLCFQKILMLVSLLCSICHLSLLNP